METPQQMLEVATLDESIYLDSSYYSNQTVNATNVLLLINFIHTSQIQTH